jgi:xanthine dehydrogenase accessory factor
LKTEALRSLLAARERGEAVVLITDLDSGDQQLVFPHRASGEGGVPSSPELLGAVRDAVRFDRAGVLEDGGRPLFLNPFNPPARVVIVGAVHIAQPLAVMAREAAFGVTVVDPRATFATEERFPGVDLRRTWPAEALEALGIDHRTAVVTVTHDPKLDDPALQTALRSPAFYVGALGSRRTHAKRVARLEEAGFGADDIARIHAPVGLPIAALTPGEIASSVLSEIIQVLRSGEA